MEPLPEQSEAKVERPFAERLALRVLAGAFKMLAAELTQVGEARCLEWHLPLPGQIEALQQIVETLYDGSVNAPGSAPSGRPSVQFEATSGAAPPARATPAVP